MAKVGVPVETAIALFNNYPDELLRDFIEKYVLIKQEYSIQEDLKLADIIATARLPGSRKGNMLYTRWRNRKLSRLDNLAQERKNLNKTLFDELRGHRKRKIEESGNTLFDRFKRISDAI